MASFFGFSGTPTTKPPIPREEPQLGISITPSSSAFYSGETFSVIVKFTCHRTSSTRYQPPSVPQTPIAASSNDDIRTPTSAAPAQATATILPDRKGQIGLSIETPVEKYNAVAGPSRLTTPIASREYLDSPVQVTTGEASRGWRKPGSPTREIKGELRSPEVMRRYGGGSGDGERRTRSLGLGVGMSPQEMVWALSGQSTPPIPARRPTGTPNIPTSHPHSRKISDTAQFGILSPPLSTTDLTETHLQSIPESTTSDQSRNRPRPTRLESSSSASSSTSHSHLDPSDNTPRNQIRTHSRPLLSPPSSTLSPPPTHPYIRSLAEPREITILWAQTRLVAHFHPSTAYIPPDPLLPLRSLLLHQPIGAGSGSLTSSTSTVPSGSRWQLSFGTGTIGHETKPSLTGSLVGLASSLVYGGSAGSLEEERKKAWNTKDLPVLETARSLLGVDIRLKEGESREYVYTFQIPHGMPPTHRGRAYRFAWDFNLSLAVADASNGKVGMRTREIEVPIRVWSHVALGNQPLAYDVLKPIILRNDQASVMEMTDPAEAIKTRLTDPPAGSGDTERSLSAYARQLLDTSHDRPQTRAISPSFDSPLSSPRKFARRSLLSPSPSMQDENGIRLADHLDIPDNASIRIGRGRKDSFIQGDEELVDEGGDGAGCDQAVEILSRHSTKASYDIAKDGDLVSVLTLLKTTCRLGETILGVVTINPPPNPSRHVLKFSAYLESNDLIPVSLLPPSPRGGVSPHPNLVKTYTDFSSGYVNQIGRLSFNLDIPQDATPGFTFGAGGPGDGGVEWKIRLAFLVTVPHGKRDTPSPMIVSAKEGDNKFYTASPSLAPIVQVGIDDGGLEELETETVECEIPIKVLPGNIGLKVRPAVYTV